MDHLTLAEAFVTESLNSGERARYIEMARIHALIAIAEELRTMNQLAASPLIGREDDQIVYPLPKPKGHRLDGQDEEYG